MNRREKPDKEEVGEPPKADSQREPSPSAPADEPTQTQPPAQSPEAGRAVRVAADPSGQLRYEPAELRAQAGRVSVDFTNASPIPHDVAIERGGDVVGKTRVITSSKATVEVNLKPGEYTYFCTVAGHRRAGMEGTLTVE